MEYAGRKCFQSDKASCCPPQQYASRFVEFMKQAVFNSISIKNRQTWPFGVEKLTVKPPKAKGKEKVKVKKILKNKNITKSAMTPS